MSISLYHCMVAACLLNLTCRTLNGTGTDWTWIISFMCSYNVAARRKRWIGLHLSNFASELRCLSFQEHAQPCRSAKISGVVAL